MDAIWKSTIDAYMGQLHNGNPEGALLDRIEDFKGRFIALADAHEGEYDIAGILRDSGMQDEYNQLFMAAAGGGRAGQTDPAERTVQTDPAGQTERTVQTDPAGRTAQTEHAGQAVRSEDGKPEAFDYSRAGRLPSVHEFLDTYRAIYETVGPNCDEAVKKAYAALFAVENRTDDLLEAQMIMEREHLVLNTVTAGYSDVIREFMEASDPHYDITALPVKATLGRYLEAKSLDEIIYAGETARAATADLAVQAQIKSAVMTVFNALIFSWEDRKKKIRQGIGDIEKNAQAMVLVRHKIREYYRFLSEDMGITFAMMESRPFYRIMMLMPVSLDALFRIKKVMHPDNIRAVKYVLFEEVLSGKSMEEILLTPQKAPYYEEIDTDRHPEIDREFTALAAELNSSIPYYQKNFGSETAEGNRAGEAGLISRVQELNSMITGDPQKISAGGMAGRFGTSNKTSDSLIDKAANKTAGSGQRFFRGLFKRT